MEHSKKVVGILAEYDSPAAIYHACKQTHKAGYRCFDSYTPFPVHGLDKAMGLPPSYLPWLVLCAGVSGAVLAISFMVWTSAYDYPLNIGGKPTWSIPAFIPITFEVTVLFSALTAVFGMIALNKLPTFYHPLFNVERFAKVTDDTFFLMIEHKDPKFDQEQVKAFLLATKAKNITVVEG